MKKLVAALLLFSLAGMFSPVFAAETRDTRVQTEPYNAPRWTDYVPAKYQNPRTDYSKGGAVAEFTVGLLVLPFSIPLLIHGKDKLNNISYAKKKDQYFKGLEQAKTMTYEQQQAYYTQLLQDCKLVKKK